MAAWYTEFLWSTSGNVFERPLPQEGRPSTFCKNSKNLASSFQALRLDTAGTTWRQWSEMKREPSNKSILVDLILTVFLWMIRDFRFRDCIWKIFLTPWNFTAGKSTSRQKFGWKRADPHLTMQWIKEVEMTKSIDDLMTSQSITRRRNYPDNEMLHAMMASALKRLLDMHVRFRKRVSVKEQHAQKYDRFLRGRQIAYMI